MDCDNCPAKGGDREEWIVYPYDIPDGDDLESDEEVLEWTRE